MTTESWQVLMTVDTISAQVLTERLNLEGVPTRLRTDSVILGAARACDILVPSELLHRAKSVLSSGQLSDAELSYLATGKLGSDRVDES
jgi:hypothetical protein